MSTPHVSLRGIRHAFGAQPVLDDVSLEVERGEFLVLVGPSGCGKSTLLRILCGLVTPDVGDVLLDGARVNDLEPSERDVALVFQNYALYPHMSVEKNLAFPLRVARRPKAEVRAKVREVAASLDLTEHLAKKPAQLSGGQMQRVALGRALVREPALFLFDEPLSNLDARLRAEMRAELARLHHTTGVTSILVTHDQAEAMTLGQRICVLSGGRVQQTGTPLEVFERPANTFVAGFVGSPAMNLVPGTITDGVFHAGSLRVPAPAGPTGQVTLGVRPHQIETGAPDGLELPITRTERLGTQTTLELALDGGSLTVTRGGDFELPASGRVRVGLPPDQLHWFQGSGERWAQGD